jgi:hypothetical protein
LQAKQESDTLAANNPHRRDKIGILTFHRCINYGSYWQARALVDGLRRRGHEAVLLDHRNADVRRAEWRCAFQPLLPQRSSRRDMRAYKEKARKLIFAADQLASTPPFALDQPETLERFDLVLVGSDEVWNMRHPWYGGRGAFYGDGLNADRIASYAASFGNHDAADGLHPFWAGKLRRFDAISVRDRNSHQMLRQSLDLDPDLVLDPVLQFPEEMPKVPVQPGETKPYIAVYGHSFPSWYAEAVRKAARDRALPLVSIGYRNDWADEQRLDYGPEEFARSIGSAAAVATNFFHGCVFSLLYGRPFACVASSYRANKLRDLMDAVGALPHLIGSEDDVLRVDDLLLAPLRPEIAARIGELRAHSDAYLARALA